MEPLSWAILCVSLLVLAALLIRGNYEARFKTGPHRLELRPARRSGRKTPRRLPPSQT
jgi:hypothetical protein